MPVFDGRGVLLLKTAAGVVVGSHSPFPQVQNSGRIFGITNHVALVVHDESSPIMTVLQGWPPAGLADDVDAATQSLLGTLGPFLQANNVTITVGALLGGYDSSMRAKLRGVYFDGSNLQPREYSPWVTGIPNGVARYLLARLYNSAMPLQKAVDLCAYVITQTKEALHTEEDYLQLSTVTPAGGVQAVANQAVDDILRTVYDRDIELRKRAGHLFLSTG